MFCRNDCVIVRRVVHDEVRGLKMPQSSLEGKDYFVHAVGQKVENLNVGDQVIITGRKDHEWIEVPGEPDLIFNTEEFVPIVLQRAHGEKEADLQVNDGEGGLITESKNDEIPVFSENSYPDADFTSKAQENMIKARQSVDEKSAEGMTTINVNVNGEDMAILIPPNTDAPKLLNKISAMCSLRFGPGNLRALGDGIHYRWR